jgi:hypothetical protein
MIRHGWLVVILVFSVLTGCAKEKQSSSGWPSFPVSIYTDPQVVATNANLEDFYAAMEFWEAGAGRKLFDYKGDWTGSQPFSGSPGHPVGIQANVVLFQSPWPFGANTAGMTTVESSDGAYKGAVVMINPDIPVCTGDCSGEYSRTSEQKLLAHELGHFLGLQHTQDPQDIMYPSLAPGGSLQAVSVNKAALSQVVR